jgi:hypothetical protein
MVSDITVAADADTALTKALDVSGVHSASFRSSRPQLTSTVEVEEENAGEIGVEGRRAAAGTTSSSAGLLPGNGTRMVK